MWPLYNFQGILSSAISCYWCGFLGRKYIQHFPQKIKAGSFNSPPSRYPHFLLKLLFLLTRILHLLTLYNKSLHKVTHLLMFGARKYFNHQVIFCTLTIYCLCYCLLKTPVFPHLVQFNKVVGRDSYANNKTISVFLKLS